MKKTYENVLGIFAMMFIASISIFEKADRDRKVKHIVARCKKKGSSISFDCDGYVVDIYKRGVNLYGPYKM